MVLVQCVTSIHYWDLLKASIKLAFVTKLFKVVRQTGLHVKYSPRDEKPRFTQGEAVDLMSVEKKVEVVLDITGLEVDASLNGVLSWLTI